MKILMVSKFSDLVGGVERHITDLTDGLVGRGHIVNQFTMDQVVDEGHSVFSASSVGPVDKVRSGRNLLWNAGARSTLSKVVDSFRPDLIHYHSIYHQLSPSVLGVGRVPSVMTLHDFKLVAPCYTLVRDGAVCTKCVTEKFKLSAVRYSCVKGSRVASAVCAVESVVHWPRYQSSISRFIVPSEYSRGHLIKGGMAADQVVVIPWGVKPPAPVQLDSPPSSRFWIYGARLHEAKGIGTLLNAWTAVDNRENVTLVVAGDGELKGHVQQFADSRSDVIYLGKLNSQELSDWTAAAEITLVPSVQPETMGLSAIESLVLGTPIMSSGAGALDDLTGEGVISVGSSSVDDWIKSIQYHLNSAQRVYELRDGLHRRNLQQYSHGQMTESIEAQYYSVLSARHNGFLRSGDDANG
ncbi:glycosyltransferase family 4 protein [Rhodococcus fascians]|nr:glycosyltransferase family 4 protein [Rhodococcus fascians]MBY4060979.1 glycosyltransferase family 4 protein [Rhodococcus fascians]MBY4071159.1 glycosyltransferase family 4 protein [Rhodococcus fascians]